MPRHASRRPLPSEPLLPDPASTEAARAKLLAAIDQLLDQFSFSKVAFLGESIPGARSPAQDRGHRLTVVLEGEKIVGFAKNGLLHQETYPANTCIFARKGAWQAASREKSFLVFGIVLESAYTRYLWARNLGLDRPLGERHFFHTCRPPPATLSDAAANLAQALTVGRPDETACHWLVGSLVALARQELLADDSSPAASSRSSLALRKWEAIQQYLIEHFHEPISRDELGEKFGLTPSYLSQLYKRFAKRSFSSSLMRLRLEHAAHLLAHSHQTVSEIAYRSGFNDTSYFSRTFHRRFQRSPRTYRLQAAPSRPSSRGLPLPTAPTPPRPPSAVPAPADGSRPSMPSARCPDPSRLV